MCKYKQILLIDDDEDDREIFLMALGRTGNSVRCEAVGDARKALDQLLDKRLETDLIFLDLNMPIMNGQQFLVEIKKHEQLRAIPVIIFSTSSHLATIQLMKDLGAMDFITKPEDFLVLVNTLQTVLN